MFYNKTSLHWHLFKKMVEIKLSNDNYIVNNNFIQLKIPQSDLEYNRQGISIGSDNNPLNYLSIIPEYFSFSYPVNNNGEIEYKTDYPVITGYKNLLLYTDSDNKKYYTFEIYFKLLEQNNINVNNDDVSRLCQ